MSKKKQYLVSLAKPNPQIKGMDVLGKIRKFSKHGHSFTLSDGGEARELDREFGQKSRTKDIVVSEIPNYKPRDDAGHRYTFSVRKAESETREERLERMRQEGWVEFKPGQWKKVAQTIE